MTLSASAGTVTSNGDGTWDWSYLTSDGPDQSQTVTITASDGSPPNATVTFALTVNNVAPVVTAAADQSSDEGDSHSFSLGSFTDPGDDGPWSVDVDWGDGTGHTTFTAASAGALPAKSHTYADGPNDYVVSVTVSEAGTAPTPSDSDSFDVHVNNVAPVVTAAADQSSDEGDSHSFSLGSFTDPGDDGPWSVDVNWGDGTGHTTFTAASAGALPAKSHTYADGPNNYVVSVTVSEAGTAPTPSDSDSFDVHVNNVAPVVTAAADQSSDEGDSHSFSLGSFTDPGDDGPWSVDVNWGDGTGHTTFTAASAGALPAKSHTYADGPNDYVVSVTVSEAGTAPTPSDSDSFDVHVNNVAPTVEFTTARG